MLSPDRIPPNNTNKRRQKISNTNLDDDSHRERDVKRPQLTSNESSPETVKPKKNKLKAGANTEINDK